MVADEDMSLRGNERFAVPPYINAQQKQQDCVTSACQCILQSPSESRLMHQAKLMAEQLL